MQAALDLLHLGLTGRAQMLCRGRAPEQQAHAGAVVDLDASRAGHTVTTATAELTAQLLPVVGDDRRQLCVHPGRVINVGEKLVQLLFPLNAPDGQNALELRFKGIGGGAVGNEAAGQALHGDKTHLMFFAQLYQFQLLLTGNIAERKLQSLVQAALNGFLGHGQAVVGDAGAPQCDHIHREPPVFSKNTLCAHYKTKRPTTQEKPSPSKRGSAQR